MLSLDAAQFIKYLAHKKRETFASLFNTNLAFSYSSKERR